MLKKLLPLLLCITCATASVNAEVIEVRKKSALNPTVSCSEVAGDPALGNELKRFLSVCGWFDAAAPGKTADYTVKAERAGAFVNVHIFRGTARVTGWRFPVSSVPRETAKTIVDTIIERVFEQLKVRGFCRSKIAFCAETSPGVRNVFICDIDGGNVQQLTNYRTLNVEPGWSPDGRTVFFSRYGRTGIDIIETTVATPRRSRIISSFRGINTGAAVSPDNRQMAVILSPDHQVDLYLLGISNRSRRRLTKGIAVEASPCWSPDGRRLAFVSDRNGNPRIFVCNADGSGQTMLPKIAEGADAVTPAWSGDDKIAYATRIRSTGNYVLAVYDMKTGENKVITKGAGSWESPGWAADNRQVVCKRTVNGKSSLWIVDTRNGRERELLRTGSRLYDPAWSPCTKR